MKKWGNEFLTWRRLRRRRWRRGGPCRSKEEIFMSENLCSDNNYSHRNSKRERIAARASSIQFRMSETTRNSRGSSFLFLQNPNPFLPSRFFSFPPSPVRRRDRTVAYAGVSGDAAPPRELEDLLDVDPHGDEQARRVEDVAEAGLGVHHLLERGAARAVQLVIFDTQVCVGVCAPARAAARSSSSTTSAAAGRRRRGVARREVVAMFLSLDDSSLSLCVGRRTDSCSCFFSKPNSSGELSLSLRDSSVKQSSLFSRWRNRVPCFSLSFVFMSCGSRSEQLGTIKLEEWAKRDLLA
ncbi:hypothetical protein EUGRSUZ_L01906 [Eucalyptus grandis]|uniref:Uncharacterized protein n=1 Tax=Eucalyptus grandis TaxID=71139 RepID=A0A058ZS02_EUCGR|nr:hypothetical protein EUGRSUZ_L01906 [Eucalyptus grandis]